jgi:hypothetical protein
VIVTLSKVDFALATHFARQAEVGGVSRVRGQDRAATLSEDNLVGQLGTLALHKYLYGHTHAYAQSRYMQNKFPTLGDQGDDLIGANVDVKTSVMRYEQNPQKYRLLVRPKEFHSGWVYVLALLGSEYSRFHDVHLVGWATAEQLPEPEVDGPFAGAHVLQASRLTQLPPIRYSLCQVEHS